MKLFMLLALVAAFARPVEARSYRVRETEPYIVKQVTDMVTHQYASPTWERHIWIRNPFRHPVWVYLECPEHLTVNPIGLPDRKTSEVVLPDIPPQEMCIVHHWYLQDGRPPKPWSP
jgi:hypothetical protein